MTLRKTALSLSQLVYDYPEIADLELARTSSLGYSLNSENAITLVEEFNGAKILVMGDSVMPGQDERIVRIFRL